MSSLDRLVAASALVLALGGCGAVEQSANQAAGATACVAANHAAAQAQELIDAAAAHGSLAGAMAKAQALAGTTAGLAEATASISPDVAAQMQRAADAFDGALAAVPQDGGPGAEEELARAASGFVAAISPVAAALGC